MGISDTEKPRRHWQNLLHKKCPNCDTRLQDSGQYFLCPNPSPTEEGRNCFFILKTKAATYLLDTSHPANFCLTPHERDTVEDSLREMGIVV